MENTGLCVVTADISASLRSQIDALRPTSVTVLTDENTAHLCYPSINENLPPHALLTVPAGEEHKDISGAERIWGLLTDLQIDRKGLLVVLGGGVLGDMGGFCAATYKRGINFILIPTTLLSQVDASVGGKLGIDFRSFKNHIGVFQQPVATLVDTRFLSTLPVSELRSGFAEVIKHCFLSDPLMWNDIRSKRLEQQDWQRLVAHSIEFKKEVVRQDPFESGLRKILNFGHTIGHAIESRSLAKGKRLLHGEAIAIGMICESAIAADSGILDPARCQELTDFILSIFGRNDIGSDDEDLIQLMHQDKKAAANEIRMAVADGKGGYDWDVVTSPAQIRLGLDYYRKKAQI